MNSADIVACAVEEPSKFLHGKSQSHSYSAPSIPSKYDNRPAQPQHDKKKTGFGSSTRRFSSKDVNIPGPGRYYRETSYIRDAKKCGSVSALGYTAIISRAPRFSDINEQNDAALPGPGDYYPRLHLTMPTTPQMNFSGQKLKMHEQIKPRVGIEGTQHVPGPGHYNPDECSLSGFKNKCTSSFKSTARKNPYVANDKEPVVGCYEVEKSVDYLYKLGKEPRKGRPFPDPIFSSTSERIAPPAHDIDIPGPGCYDEELFYHGKMHFDKQSAVFDTSLDRSGNSVWHAVDRENDITPGPGSYFQDYKDFPINNGAAAIFQSTSDRFEGINSDDMNPGPGKSLLFVGHDKFYSCVKAGNSVLSDKHLDHFI